ncbi:DUF7619 domain-containing protein [Xanthocytophaga flava]|uniref:DUF7619 domain-containing protein n=1 Tax=Xanthocytophaga flava TaxID=3048013 RepID=UPI0028D7B681|nr:T9SS type A sorting domain-containing protein [Xanthocytophaga flavus]MDJ1473788.1 T9SS type A sorting domain-containing protein [Xanthocytophaga flavus]
MTRFLLLLLLNLFIFLTHFLYAQDDLRKWAISGDIYTAARSGNTVYLGGKFSYVGPVTGGAALLNPTDGRVVNNRSILINGTVRTALEDGQGGWYIGGNFSEIQGVKRNGIAHLLADNSLDLSWQVDITYPLIPAITKLARSNNTLYLLGKFTAVNGEQRTNAAAIDLKSLKVTPWNPVLTWNSIMDESGVYCMVVVNNKVYLGGNFSSISGQLRTNLAELDATTGAVTPWIMATDGPVKSLAVFKDHLYVGGGFLKIGGVKRERIACIDLTNGTLTDWALSLIGGVEVLVVSESKLYIGGQSLFGGDFLDGNIVGYDLISNSLLSWRLRGLPDIYLQGFNVWKNTIYVVGGTSRGQMMNYAAAFDATTGRQLDWNPGLNGMASYVYASENSVLVSGYLHSVGGKFRNNFAAIDITTGLVSNFNPNIPVLSSRVKKISAKGNLLYMLTDTSLVRIDLMSNQVTTWSFKLRYSIGTYIGNGYFNDIIIEDGIAFLGGMFHNIDGVTRNNLAALNLTTGTLANWNPDANGEVIRIAAFKDLIYAGGNFNQLGGRSRSGLGSVYKTSGIVTSWNPKLEYRNGYDGSISKGKVRCLEIFKNSLYVGGEYTHIDDKPRNRLTEVDILTHQIKPLQTIDNSVPSTLAILDTVLYIGYRQFTYGGTTVCSTITGQTTDWNLSPLPPFIKSAVNILNIEGGIFSDGYGGELTPYNPFPSTHLFTLHLQKTFVPNIANHIEGTVFHDKNGDCKQNEGEEPIPGVVVVAEPGSYYSISDKEGKYSIEVDTGIFTVSQRLDLEKNKIVTQFCPSSKTHTVSFKMYNTISLDNNFGDKVILTPYLTTSVTSTRRRRCFSGQTTISYCNAGGISASDVKVYLQLPPYVVLVSASVPYTQDENKNYVFSVGNLNAEQCGSIWIVDSVMCNNPSIRGLTQCTKVWITPVNTRTISSQWDQSDITLKAQCVENGRIRLGIYNTGSGNMSDSTNFRIYLDANLAFTSKTKLAAGDSLLLKVPANGKTLRLEVDQHSAHPVKQSTNLTIEACGINSQGNVSLGFVAQLPSDDPEPEVDIECLPIIDSYDPNDKLVLPTGISTEHYTSLGKELEYTIRFQNTGTDYAYKVVIIDTLSEKLDISTLQVKNASHPYTFTVSGKGNPILTWTFRDINLPDSTRDQKGSNGFVKFTVKPLNSLPIGERIENYADIFFDYNPAVRTNTVFNTLYIPSTIVSKDHVADVVVCKLNMAVYGGKARSFCEQDTIQMEAQNPLYGEGRWKRIKGGAQIDNPSDPYTLVTGLTYGENTFIWSIPAGSCNIDSLQTVITIIRYQNPIKPVIAKTGTLELRSSIEAEEYNWLWNGTSLSDNTQKLKVKKGGTYTLKVTSHDCMSEFSDPYEFILTSQELIELTGIYPSPTESRFVVELPEGVTEATIDVYDRMSRVIIHQVAKSKLNEAIGEEFDLTNYAVGVYFVKIQTKDAVFVKRIVLCR